jgi:hypothetical protein
VIEGRRSGFGRKMKRLAVLFWLVGCGMVWAQSVTDMELQAAYCLGVSTAQLNEETAAIKVEKEPSTRALHKDIAKVISERQQRFRDYIIVKGFGGDRNPQSLKVALSRGEADVSACETELQDDFFKSCGDRCRARYGNASEAAMACNVKCPSPDACVRVKKCLVNFLPF